MATPSLQRHLLALVLVGTVLVWALVSAVVYRLADHELEELLDAHLAQAAALLIVQQQQTPEDDEQERAEPPSLHKYAPQVAYQVYQDGRMVIHSPNVTHTPLAPIQRGYLTVTRSDGAPWRVFAAHGNTRGVQVYVAERLHVREHILGAVMRALLMPLAVGLPLLGGVLWWSVRRGLRPVGDLRHALQARNPQSLTPVQLLHTPAELQPLVHALNDLLERLRQQLDIEKRFTADAAHELRTPIAAIRTQAQVALGEPQTSDVQRLALQATLQGCDRASHLVDQLLELVRVEAQTDTQRNSSARVPTPTIIPLADALQPVCADLALQALDKSQTLDVDAEPHLHVRGPLPPWQMLLRNLIDNAIRYTPQGGTVRVTARATAPASNCTATNTSPSVQVTVEDNGPGLTADQQARLGERFFRVLGNHAEGSGLGWSIVRRVAAQRGIQVVVDRSPELGGLRVRLIDGGTATSVV